MLNGLPSCQPSNHFHLLHYYQSPGAVSNGVRVSKRDKDKRSSRRESSVDNSGNDGSTGNKFSTTWRPVGDYVHLKIQFQVSETNLQVQFSAILTWMWILDTCHYTRCILLDHWSKLSALGDRELPRML